jgi:hypothetical protein
MNYPKKEERMTNLSSVVSQLRKERTQVQVQLDELERAISALQGLNSGSRSARGGPRRLSASARKRIAAAQKARWAKWHQQQGQNNQKATPKRVVSIASRRKMAAAQRARRANRKKAA